MKKLLILGKGWSLDRLDWPAVSGADWSWWGINEAAFVALEHALPGSGRHVVGISTDEDQFVRHGDAYQATRGQGPAGGSGLACLMHRSQARQGGLSVWGHPPEFNGLVSVLFLRTGPRFPLCATAPLAVALAACCGYRQALLAGFDSLMGLQPPSESRPSEACPQGQTYASCLRPYARSLVRPGGPSYRDIDDQVRSVAWTLGVELLPAPTVRPEN